MISPTLQPESNVLHPSSSHSFLLVLFHSFLHVPLAASHDTAMAIEKEPGQKGINWSNIAVGELTRHDTTNELQLTRVYNCQVAS